MPFRRLILASIALACLGCVSSDPCDSSSNPDYAKPLTANLLKGCWDKIIRIPAPLRDTLSYFCFGDSTRSLFEPSQGVRQFSCAQYQIEGNKMNFDSSRFERYDSLNGAWQLMSMYKDYGNNIAGQNWAISKDTLVHFEFNNNPYACSSIMIEYKYVRHTGRIDSSGIRHCDSLGYR